MAVCASRISWALATIIGFLSGPVVAAEWKMDTSRSRLIFIFEEAGSDEQGRFENFTAEFHIDPNALETSRFSASIQINSLVTGDKDRDGILRSADMFDVVKWPVAEFKTKKIIRKDGNNYVALASLTIRDSAQEIQFPFSLEITKDKDKTFFRMQSNVVISRLQFGVGQGEWSDATWIGDDVSVQIDIYATKKS